jgi:hypothetical protein
MEFREGLSSDLPPHRSDEPAGLRRDILDELADHLTCSYHRELLRGLNSTVARARALDQFGDPAGVARRLWLDAIKGKIMAQRLVIATCLLVTAASLLLAGIFWVQSNRAAHETSVALRYAEEHRWRAEQALAESNRRLAEASARNQTTSVDASKPSQKIQNAMPSPPRSN